MQEEILSLSEKVSTRIYVKGIFELSKVRITIFVALTTALGYILASDTLSFSFLYPTAGIFLLACSSAVVNHIQENKYDKIMVRTMYRPIPSGLISIPQAVMISALLFISGISVLYLKTNLNVIITGILTYIAYNFIYTPLKRKISWAIIPGSLVGALPPVAGWIAAGKGINNTQIILIAAFLFIWQIPHFWLLLIANEKDYRKAGFPVLTDRLSRVQLVNYIFGGLILTAISAIYFVSAGYINYTILSVLIFLLTGLFIYHSAAFLKRNRENRNIKDMFIKLNIYTLIFLVLLLTDKLIKLI
jgi:protoheme IX farnesyltransferase